MVSNNIDAFLISEMEIDNTFPVSQFQGSDKPGKVVIFKVFQGNSGKDFEKSE